MEVAEQIFEHIAFAVDLVGIGIILWGFSIAFKEFVILEVSRLRNIATLQSLQVVRCHLGTYLLVGLEFMIASDIIHTFITRSQDDLIFLGTIVVIRTAIGFFLGKELQEIHTHAG